MAKKSTKAPSGRRLTPYLAGIAIIIILAVLAVLLWGLPTGFATTPVTLQGTVTATITCSASPGTLNFGTITLDSDKTTSAGTVVDMAGSTATTALTASVTDTASWFTGFTSESTSWGISCPTATGEAVGGLTDSVGYKKHKFNPNSNDCRKGAGITGQFVGQGTGTVPTLSQVTTTHDIFSRIKVPIGGAATGSYSSTVTFTCSELTGLTAGLSFEVADIENNAAADNAVLCDGSADNVYVIQGGKGTGPAVLPDSPTAPVIFVCDAAGKCVQATVSPVTAGVACPNIAPPVFNTPNLNVPTNDIACGRFKCGAGLTAGAGQVFIESTVTTPAATVQAYKDVTISLS